MRILQNSLIRLTKICLIFVCLTNGVGAQVKADGKSALAGFEKKIEDGRLSDVEKDLFAYVVANPKDAGGFSLLGRLRFKQSRLTEAKSLLNKALSIDPELLPAKLTLSQVSFQLGEIEQARGIVGSIAEKDISIPSRRLAVAEISALVGDCPKALMLAEKLPLAIRNGEALPLRATCLLEAGDRKALSLLIPLTKTPARQNPKLAIKFAEVLNKAAMHRETADLLRLVISAAPRNIEALLLLAKAEVFLKDFSRAGIHLAAAEKIQPKSAETLFVKALLESEQGNNSQALETLKKALAEDPDNIQVLARFVVVALRSNQSGPALRAADKLLDLRPESLDFLYLQGIASLQNNKLQKAETALTNFLNARPNDGLGCLALGMTYAAQPDKLGEARRQMENCLAVNPGNFEAAYQLGLSYKVQGDSAKAIEYLEQTVRLAPNYAAALRDLGTVYLQSGGEAKARPVLEKAALLEPKDAETHFQLSRLYNLIGERDLGKKELEIFQRLKSTKKDGM